MTCAEDFLKFLCKSVLENCVGEINFFSKRFDKTNVDRLQSIISSSFERISYTQAVDALKQVTDNKFETKVEWGLSLTEEHETYVYILRHLIFIIGWYEGSAVTSQLLLLLTICL